MFKATPRHLLNHCSNLGNIGSYLNVWHREHSKSIFPENRIKEQICLHWSSLLSDHFHRKFTNLRFLYIFSIDLWNHQTSWGQDRPKILSKLFAEHIAQIVYKSSSPFQESFHL